MKRLLSLLFISILTVGGWFLEKTEAGVPPAALNRMKPVKTYELVSLFKKHGIECREESVRSQDQALGVTRHYKCSTSEILRFSSEVESRAATKTEANSGMYIKKQYIVITKEKAVQNVLVEQGFDPIQT